ncbi:hypothetical protein [Pseudorhodoplanes sp.]
MSTQQHTVVAQRLVPVVASAAGRPRLPPAKRATGKRVSRRQ